MRQQILFLSFAKFFLAYWGSPIILAHHSGELSHGTQQAIFREAARLGEARVPDRTPDDERDEAQRVIDRAFQAAFRRVCYVAAALAWAGTVVAISLPGRVSLLCRQDFTEYDRNPNIETASRNAPDEVS